MMQITSDALVFFGATGYLAYKKIFPALQKLAGRGKLELRNVGRGVQLLDGTSRDRREGPRGFLDHRRFHNF